jgi:hypothetical protein
MGSPDPRDESEAQRDDRNLAELLQELRVAGLGVQVLFGFLLSLPFTNRFDKLSPAQRDLYLASLVLAAVATALLVGPVAYHRLVFRRGQKESLVRAASVMAIAGLAAVGLAVSAAVLLDQLCGQRIGCRADHSVCRRHVRHAMVRVPPRTPKLIQNSRSSTVAVLSAGRRRADQVRAKRVVAAFDDPHRARLRAHRKRLGVHALRGIPNPLQ